jgi:hypothetical protein
MASKKSKAGPASASVPQAQPSTAMAAVGPDWKAILVRVGAVAAVLWVIAFIVPGTAGTWLKGGVGVLTVVAAGALVWFKRYITRTQQLGAILQNAASGADKEAAIKQIEQQFGTSDAQAAMAKAQLELQLNQIDAALATLSAIDLTRQMVPIADQVRAMRATIHLSRGEVKEARVLVDAFELGKQQDNKTRAMLVAVAAEAWARTGMAQKASDQLSLFNPEDPEYADLRVQMLRARAHVCIHRDDVRGAQNALQALAATNPFLMGMFAGQKHVHPLLEREARKLAEKAGAVQRQVQRVRR